MSERKVGLGRITFYGRGKPTPPVPAGEITGKPEGSGHEISLNSVFQNPEDDPYHTILWYTNGLTQETLKLPDISSLPNIPTIRAATVEKIQDEGFQRLSLMENIEVMRALVTQLKDAQNPKEFDRKKIVDLLTIHGKSLNDVKELISETATFLELIRDELNANGLITGTHDYTITRLGNAARAPGPAPLPSTHPDNRPKKPKPTSPVYKTSETKPLTAEVNRALKSPAPIGRKEKPVLTTADMPKVYETPRSMTEIMAADPNYVKQQLGIVLDTMGKRSHAVKELGDPSNVAEIIYKRIAIKYDQASFRERAQMPKISFHAIVLEETDRLLDEREENPQRYQPPKKHTLKDAIRETRTVKPVQPSE